MKKFLLGLLTGLILTVLTLVIIGFSLVKFGDRRPMIAEGSTLLLRIDGDVPEKPPVEIPIPFIGERLEPTVRDYWAILRNAARDNRVKAVVLMPEGVSAGWGKLHELRQGVLEYKKSGKPIVAFLRAPRMRDYYLASAADKIYVSPEDVLDVKGMRAELMYFKRTLDKVGAQMEIEHIGKYKDAGDMFTETSPTPETLEVMNSVLDGVYSEIVGAIAQGRKKSPEDIRRIIDTGPFTAEQAKANGLVDTLYFEDQVFGDLKSQLKQAEITKLSTKDYLRGGGTVSDSRKKIALVVGEGNIVRGSGEDAMASDEAFSASAFVKLVREVANDNSVQGVILRVDSPGGDAVASDEILREVKLLSQKKPMVISMSDYAASGGYYVSMTGDPIVAYPSTLTGSIGIVYGKVNLRGLYDKVGISKEILTRGQNAAIDSDYVPMTDAARVKLREVMQDFYDGFLDKVATGRNKNVAQIAPLAEGRVWLGAQAKANGLIDETGGLDRAIELVKSKAKIGANESIRLVPYPPRMTIWEQWMKSTTATTAESEIERKVRAYLGGFDYKVWAKGGILRILPYSIKVE